MLIRIDHIFQCISIPVIADHLLSEDFKSQTGHFCSLAIDGEKNQETPDHSLLLTKTN